MRRARGSRVVSAASGLAGAVARASGRMPGAGRLLGPLRRRLGTCPVRLRHGTARGMRMPLGAALGFRLGDYERDLQEALERLLEPGGVLYDVGANAGLVTLAGARLLGPAGAVVAFEPNRQAERSLRAAVAMNGLAETVTVRAQAVADHEGEGTLITPAGAPEHALLATAAGVEDFAPPGSPWRVEITTIDACLAAGLPAPTVVKLDVQGSEGAALAGMRRTLEEHRPAVVCELHGTAPAVERAIAGTGYRPHGLHGAPRQACPPEGHVLLLPA